MTTRKNEKVPPAVSLWPLWHENKPFALMLMLTFAFLIAFLMARTTLALGEAARLDQPEPFEHQITIEGVGTATGTPDIAQVSVGIDSKGATVASAQVDNTNAINALIAALVALGVSKDDLQTANYTVYEDTVFNPDTETYEAQGWIVSQLLTVKVRDTSKVSAVLDAAGTNGATSISGPNFTIDDPGALKDEARVEAISDATDKAAKLATTLGVRLERVIGYSEWTDSSITPFSMYDKGIGEASTDVVAGLTDVTLMVSVTYKLVD